MNINNIKLLLKCYFIENGKRDLIWTFGLMALISFLLVQGNPYGSMMTAESLVALIFLFIYPDRVFRLLNNTSKSIHYLMIPASTKDKVTAGILLVNIYMVVGLLLSVWVGYSLSYLVLELRNIEGIPSYMERYEFDNLGWGICTIYAALSACFFGSIYFRRKGLLKTVGVSMAIGLVTMLLTMLVVWLNFRLKYGSETPSVNFSYNLSDSVMSILYYSLCAIGIVFFYGLSFLRMKETEA